ncbi:MAG TPA: PQQ-dependent sugar dehydrogenase [Actinophytocola sp.]|uniref:PQQ-dependent sugar dehydrogenase n=1 Tax=Actinophytocola sp. TaxID=1872138 RepID=UPI002DBF6513|nr:PQQ-dependent sugar dehydrogenase [Actinophytocola sp.]HEU5473363.1 PQQ-dependent sugar dehydrogenase [Actinophytocola sp.]
MSRSPRRELSLFAAGGLLAAGLSVLPVTTADAAVPPGFTDTAAITGLTAPTAAAFASDGRVFVAEKSGILKVFDSLTDTTPTIAADLRPQVHDFWDRGLLGLAVDPQFPTRPYVYVLYSYDALPGGTHPRWGDQCPTPPGATDQGCVITGRLSKLTLGANGVATAEQVLITDWCQQYPSHSIGTVTFGPDGALYVGGGDGASFNFADYGQVGNPCGDPPSPAGTNLSPPNAKGGALRSQSPRRPSTEPVTLDGAVLRVDPDTGAGLPGNPFAASTDANARRVIAYGLRNQFRFGFRPGGNELWVGDVGWGTWEEINRIPNATDAVAENFGWPCFEGTPRQTGYDGANLTVCESLYSGGGQTAPYYAYNHNAPVVAGDGCPTGGSSISGIAFENGTSNYPAAYAGALFFSDASRGCIWAMQRGTNGQPDPARLVALSTGVATPVQTLTGPGGDLFYVALGSGQLRRISFPGGTNRPPTAVATATPPTGPAPLTVQFNGSGSTDPDADDTLTYAWDLDGDGTYDDSTTATPTFTYTQQALVNVGLRVTDSGGLSGSTTVLVTVGNPTSQNPVPLIDTPTTALRWQVGQTVPFSGQATDAQDGTLPPSAMSWQLTLQHCTTPTNCHAHVVQNFPGVAAGSFVAPDHEYPSYLDLTLTATDSDGNSASTTVRMEPRTVQLSFTSTPNQVLLTIGGVSQRTPFSRTVIVGSNNSISAPSPQNVPPLNLRYRWVRWSDGGAQTHNIIAPATAATWQATYQWCLIRC